MANNVPFLQMRYVGSLNSPAVYSVYPDGRLELVGDPDFDTAGSIDLHESRINRVIEFEGDIYAIHGGRIYILNKGTNTWGLDTGAATTARPESLQFGFSIVNITGVPYLYAPQSTSAMANTAVRLKRSPNFGGTTWTETTLSTTLLDNGTDGQYFDNIMFRNNFYQQAQDGVNTLNEVMKFDFSLTAWSTVLHAITPSAPFSSGSNVYGPSSFCAYNNKLYELMFAGENGSAGVPQTIYLQEIEGGGAFGSTHALTIVSGLKAVTNVSDNTLNDRNYGRTTMFIDSTEDKIYAFAVVQSGQGFTDGWACFEIEESGGQLRYLRDVGSTVLPQQIAFSSASTNRPLMERFHSYNTVDESGNQVVYLEYEPNPLTSNTATNFYKWLGPDTPMEFLGFQPAGVWSKPRIRQGEGSHIFSDNVPFDFSFTVESSGSPATTPGTMALKTTVHGSGQPIELAFLFNKEGETNLTRADIFSASSGISDETNKRVIEVRAEGVEITCQWRAQSDGVALNEKFTVMPIATVTGIV